MAFAIEWDKATERLYETGVDRCVLYVMRDTVSDPDEPYEDGVAWNGITAINESPSGGEPTPLWADNIKYLNLISAEEFGASLEAYMYPEEFYACDGTIEVTDDIGAFMGQQPRKQFALTYRTLIGNDTDYNNHGYKLHIIYGCFATPTEKAYSTVNDSPEAATFSWTISTTPIAVSGKKPTAHIWIDSTKFGTGTGQRPAAKLTALEEYLYGTVTTENNQTTIVKGKLPLPSKVIDLLT